MKVGADGTAVMSGRVIGDIKGGVSAAMTAVPVELVYGLFAVAPLGVAYAEHGMRAALWGCILGGLLAFFFRGTPGMLTGTRPATGLILGALATALLQQPEIRAATDPAWRVFTLLLACTALAGLFMSLFGLAQVGRVFKYIPFPVTSGLMLGVGILMLLGSIRPALGVDAQAPWHDGAGLFASWHFLAPIVTLITLAICFIAPRWKSPLPGTVLAFVFGSAAHHLLGAMFGSAGLGGSSANLTNLMPDWMLWNAGMDIGALFRWLPMLASYALTIAAIGALETMLCLSAIGAVQPQRPSGNRELRLQGLSNLFAGSLGATASFGNLSRVSINLASGGSGRLSAMAYAATLALIVIVAGNHLSLVPNAVTAGIVIYYAIGMADDGARRIFSQIIVQRKQFGERSYRELLENFSVILLVASVAVVGDMMKAVGIGVAAAMFLFVRTRMKPVVRRVMRGDRRRSLKIRAAEDVALLERQGREIAVIEADGPLFFGTADSLSRTIETVAADASQIIIDLRHVQDIDSTGARTLLQASRRLVEQGRRLLISGASAHFRSFLNSMGLERVLSPGHWHHDLDHALEDAEDHLLDQAGGQSGHYELRLTGTDLAKGLSGEEVAQLETFLHKQTLLAGTAIFHIDDEGDSLFVAGDAGVDILIPLKDGNHKRIVSLAPGVIFGEMAMLEGKRRSTTAVLQGQSVVWALSRQALDAMLRSHPQIARQVLFNVGCQLAGRLRTLTGEVILLEES